MCQAKTCHFAAVGRRENCLNIGCSCGFLLPQPPSNPAKKAGNKAGSLNAELDTIGVVVFLGVEHGPSKDGETLCHLMFHTTRDSHILVHFDLQLGGLHKVISDASCERPLLLAQEVASSSALQLFRSRVGHMSANCAELVLGHERAEILTRLQAEANVRFSDVGHAKFEAPCRHANGMGHVANKIIRLSQLRFELELSSLVHLKLVDANATEAKGG